MSGILPVLVVEDDASIREGLVDSFTARDEPVDVAVDGAMALERLGGTARYRAVVLDLKLPRIDGLEVLRRIRAAGNATPVVVVTARGEEAQRIEELTDQRVEMLRHQPAAPAGRIVHVGYEGVVAFPAPL